MRRRLVVLAAMSMLVGLVVTPSAPGKALTCKTGSTMTKVNGHASCVVHRLVLPAPTTTAPALAQLQDAIDLTQVGFTGRSGRRAAPLARRVGHSWTTARSRVLKAMTAAIARAARPLQRPVATAAAADGCQALELLSPGGSFDVTGAPAVGGSFSSNGVDISMGLTSSGGMELGVKATIKGNTYTMKYESSLSDCTKHALPQCPEADGTLNNDGTKGKIGFSMTVARGGKVLTKRSYNETVSFDTKGLVADDAKLDTVDVRYTETTVVDDDGVHYTSYGTRPARIDMRSGTTTAGESTAFGSATVAGAIVNARGLEASAREFAAFLGKTIDEYRARETAWQAPGTCANLALDPASDTITAHRGTTGTFSAQVNAVNGGGSATKARWTLSDQQNGSFSPTTTNDRQPSFSYTVTTQSDAHTVSVTVRATSTAGVAQSTWTEKIDDQLNTITGTFTGHSVDSGVIYDWTGSATFQRLPVAASFAGPGGVLGLTAGQATVTVSGTDGTGCSLTGTSTIGLIVQSPWTVTGSAQPFSYQIVAPFLPDVPQATRVHCSDPLLEGTPAGLGSIGATALQSGDIAAGANLTGLVRTTDDVLTYTGSATADGPLDDETAAWTWSFKESY
jgi:hypothetical protein